MPLTDVYQKGKLFQGLLHFKNDIKEMTGGAKDALADYIAAELDGLLKKKDSLTDDEDTILEIAADVCQYFLSDKITSILKEMLTLKRANISYYAVGSLLAGKNEIDPSAIAHLAQDLGYANLTYYLLKKHGLIKLFPKEFSNDEYLAKSDMVHWLMYPTELGKAPNAIELLGTAKVKSELFYIFKFISGSDTLDDETKNEWLIGWSSNDGGGTFSNFDKLSDFEKENPKKTLKHIVKELIG
jgi:hypothetical protein